MGWQEHGALTKCDCPTDQGSGNGSGSRTANCANQEFSASRERNGIGLCRTAHRSGATSPESCCGWSIQSSNRASPEYFAEHCQIPCELYHFEIGSDVKNRGGNNRGQKRSDHIVTSAGSRRT